MERSDQNITINALQNKNSKHKEQSNSKIPKNNVSHSTFRCFLEIGDKLSNISIKFEHKHPIIIHSDYKLTRLLITLIVITCESLNCSFFIAQTILDTIY